MGQKLAITPNSVSAPPPPIRQDRDPVAMLLHWAETRPNSVYLRQPVNGVWREYTWLEVADQVKRMASALRDLGINKGDVVAISGRNTAHWIMADMAIAMAGGISVAIYPNQATDATNYVLTHSEAKAIFLGPLIDPSQVTDALPDGIVSISLPYPDTGPAQHSWSDLVSSHQPMTGFEPRDPSELWTLIYTSGTTGKPKGVMLNGEGARISINGILERLEFQDDEHFFSYLPLAHIFERGAVELSSLYVGATISFMESLDKLGEQLAEVAPTRFFGVPVVFGRIQTKILEKLPQKKMDRLLRIPILSGLIRKKIVKGLGLQNARMVVSGAAPLAESVIDWFGKLGINIVQGYGMSENAAYCSVNLPNENRTGSVGRPMPGVDVRIDENSGEILTRSAATMMGYYKNPEKTAETITDGWLHTGDKGRIDKDGYLFITGRIKDAFKTAKGKYVDPAPIEDRISSDSAIDQVCLIGSGLKLPVAVIRIDSEDERSEITARLTKNLEALNKTLEPHEKICKLLLTTEEWTAEAGLMTPTMKIRRPELEAHYRSQIEQSLGSDDTVIWI